jgi:hypothetical protein
MGHDIFIHINLPKVTVIMAKRATKQAIIADDQPEDNPATAPAAVGASGVILDTWGLPAHGPLRTRALEAMGRSDPNHDLSDWPEGEVAQHQTGNEPPVEPPVLGVGDQGGGDVAGNTENEDG